MANDDRVQFSQLQYWEERLTNNWGLQGVGYLELGSYYNFWLYKIQKTVFVRNVKRLPLDIKKGHILDIGSGVGFYIKSWMFSKPKYITATDISPFVVQNLKKDFPNIDCEVLDISKPLPESFNKKFNIISAFAVLYHIINDGDYLKALENISCMLEKNGFFIFSENLIHSETIRTEHQVNRSLKYVEHALEKNNLRIILRRPVYFFMNTPVDSQSKILKIVWGVISRLSKKYNVLGFILGAALFPVDFVLTLFTKEGPSTEMVVCQKI